MDTLDAWFSAEQREQTIERLIRRVGLTRVRADCFLRLWIHAIISENKQKPPLSVLTFPTAPVICTHRQAAELFYSDRDRGSDRSAGMMLDKLAALGLIEKVFDGNTTRIRIKAIEGILAENSALSSVDLYVDSFDPRCDAVPVADLLTRNYHWMNRDSEALPHRISRILRAWADRYPTGARVLRRRDNLHPVGFYFLYPTASESEVKFFASPDKALHLSALGDTDPFTMALPGDKDCLAVFVRSWMIEPSYMEEYRSLFLEDTRDTLRRMTGDFPALRDLYTLIIHPHYERLASALGFQKILHTRQRSIYWMYLGLDRFLALDLENIKI